MNSVKQSGPLFCILLAVLFCAPASSFAASSRPTTQQSGNTTPASRPATPRRVPTPRLSKAELVRKWISLYQRGKRIQRLYAMRHLAKEAPGNRSIIPTLLKALGDRYQLIAMYAGDALRKYGLGLIPTLRPLLKDPRRRLYTIGVIANMGPRALPELKAIYKRSQWRSRLWIVQFLPKLVPQSLPLMARALSDPKPIVRLEAIILLGRLKEKARPTFSSLLLCLNDPSPRIRHFAIKALVKLKTQQEILAQRLLLLGALAGQKEKVQVLRALQQLGKASVIALDWARWMSMHASATIRKTAKNFLHQWQRYLPTRLKRLLKQLEYGTDWKQQRTAALRWKAMGNRGFLLHPFLNRALKSPFLVRVAIVETLQKLGSRTAPTMALVLKSDKHWVLRQDAARTLGKWGVGAKPALETLQNSALADSHAKVRISTLLALARVATLRTQVESVFKATLRDAKPAIRLATVRAILLWGKRTRKHWPTLRKAFKDSNAEVREEARAAFNSLSSFHQ